MFYSIIDCGTTNSRAYIVDETGSIFGTAKINIGVKDTATTGSKQMLREGLREIIQNAVAQANINLNDLRAVLSSGMITSEIGLYEIPHLMAPCTEDMLARTITKVVDTGIVDADIPVYFVRGIKNKMQASAKEPTALVGELDFMRGEEVQVVGMIKRSDFRIPGTMVVLSSHTKFIPVSKDAEVLGSLTTMSGQLYDAVMNHTFVGKSVEKRDNADEKPQDYFDESIVENAIDWINKGGIVRALMFPRFLEVLLDTKWYERHLFYEALIAAEDMLAIDQLSAMCGDLHNYFALVGGKERCRLYSYVLKRRIPNANVNCISDSNEIDSLSITGILSIARKAGIVK